MENNENSSGYCVYDALKNRFLAASSRYSLLSSRKMGWKLATLAGLKMKQFHSQHVCLQLSMYGMLSIRSDHTVRHGPENARSIISEKTQAHTSIRSL